VAHTADEFVAISELEAAAGHYATLAKALLEAGPLRDT
jgi:acetylornithine deacetylase/succinyl-diaminopimelate desuccinylase-like protein